MAEENNVQVAEDEENVVTMVDVLKAEETMEENADAVLGPGDDLNCTYREGYLKRQALYSCLTCLPADGTERAGICLACSYHCHEDHDLVELYTKRNFRCDCGTTLFKDQKCKIDPAKSGVNEMNKYNKNFVRLYCSCNRPYPDPDDEDEDMMLQCSVCEDWFHSKHLGCDVPNEDDFAEMFCGSCTDKLPFLQYYLGFAVHKTRDEENKADNSISLNDSKINCDEKSECISPPNTDPAKNLNKNISEIQGGPDKESSNPEHTKMANGKETKDSITVTSPDEKTKPEEINGISEVDLPNGKDTKKLSLSPSKEKKDTNESCDQEKDEGGCLLMQYKKLSRGVGATFWREGVRSIFCTCASCLELYRSCGVPFITDKEDTVLAYEVKGKSNKTQMQPTQYERGMEALSSLGRVQQMEAILSYNEMKSHLSEYLAKFAENKKVVREEDIKEFFSGMQARKRQKLDIPHFCR